MAWFESLPQILHDISKEINKIKYKLSNDILNVLRKLWSQIQLVLKNKKISNMSYDDENMTKNNINTIVFYKENSGLYITDERCSNVLDSWNYYKTPTIYFSEAQN